MASKAQLAEQVRFGLEQLSSKNAHHEFEHLCRHMARARLCSNILPATGPVQAGGDQGRDIETYRTFLQGSAIADSAFVALATDTTIVFACSLSKDVPSKVKSDVGVICSHGVPIPQVYFLSSRDVTVASRHELKSWAMGTHSVELEIIDGRAISELLTEPDVFWIAVEYLKIPAELYPRYLEEDAAYSELLEGWRDRTPDENSYADFVEVKSGLRNATFSETVRQDIGFWLGRMSVLAAGPGPTALSHMAAYECAVARLRGQGTLSGYEGELRNYFASPEVYETLNSVRDAVVLLTYCAGWGKGRVELAPDELDTWREGLRTYVENQLDSEKRPTARCLLLHIRAVLVLSVCPAEPHLQDIDKLMACWLELSELIEKAPQFPLDSLHETVARMSTVICDDPRYRTLRDRLDDLLAKRHGAIAAGDKCHDRAARFLQHDRIIHAIEELHRAKANYFCEETLRGSILAIFLLSKCYAELKLGLAAKYYALAGAFAALHGSGTENLDLGPKGLAYAADYEYRLGSWLGSLEILDSASGSPAAFLDENQRDEFAADIAFPVGVIYYVTTRIAPELRDWVEGQLRERFGVEAPGVLLEQVKKNWGAISDDELWRHMEQQMMGRPYGDAGAVRSVRWPALGVEWEAIWDNDYECTAFCEYFVAVFQIYLAELAGVDLCLMRTKVSITLGVVDNAPWKIEPEPSNVGRRWKVSLSRSDEERKGSPLHALLHALVACVVEEVSLLPEDQYMAILTGLFKGGLASKVLVGRPYDELYDHFIGKERFEVTSRRSKETPEESRPFSIGGAHSELFWVNGPGPNYSKDTANAAIARRYEKCLSGLSLILPRLRASEDFMTTVGRLREKGWLDWHVLTAILNIVVNHRMNAGHPEWASDPGKQARVEELMGPRPEMDGGFPISMLSEELMTQMLDGTKIVTLRGSGLELRQSTPDFGAIDDFLASRYHYWDDDIEHDDPFRSMTT